MMTDQDFINFKVLCDKHGIKFSSDTEARNSAYHLLNFVKIVYSNNRETQSNRKRQNNRILSNPG